MKPLTTARSLAASLALTLALAGCSKPEPDAGLKVYRHSAAGVPTNIDPLQAATVYSNLVVVNAYDTLYRYKYLERPYTLTPNLAAAMPEVSEDGLVYTIPLKKSGRYIDSPAFEGGKGRTVTAHDVVFSLKRHFDPENTSQGKWLWAGRIKGMEAWAEAGADYEATVPGLRALDDFTLRVELTAPFPQFVHTLAMCFAAVVPPEAVAAYGRDLGTRAVGSGPYELLEYSKQQVRFQPNPNFREEPLDLEAEGYDPAAHAAYGLADLDGKAPPFVDRLEIDFIQESSARWASFTSGREIQFSGLPVEQTEAVLASKDPITLKPEYAKRYHMESGPEAGLVFTVFNMDDPDIGYHEDPEREARNRELRCAMRDAFDWEARNQRFYSGLGIVFPGVIPPILEEFDASLSRASVAHNPQQARERLKAAGWNEDNLPVLDYGLVSSVLAREMFESFRGRMVDVGIPREKINGETFATFGDYNRALRTSKLSIMGYGWQLDYPDAENVLQLFYGPNAAPGSNASNYDNPEYNRLFRQTKTMQPGPERTEIYRRMNRMLIEDCVGIIGLTRSHVSLWHKDVKGLPDTAILGGFWLRFVDVDAATP
ncbi:MAG: ABC transporter substrate-binding protein [Algiphilus sp.]